jgi:hypothetical protein
MVSRFIFAVSIIANFRKSLRRLSRALAGQPYGHRSDGQFAVVPEFALGAADVP